MSIFVAFIRGINVGGKNKIKMTELKHALEEIGLANIETYIQSGNVIFESDENAEILQGKIEHVLERNFGIVTYAVLRTGDELKELIKECPFSHEEIARAESLNSEGVSLYVNLSKEHIQGLEEYLNKFKSETDDFRIRNRDTYILLQHSIRNSALANKLQKIDSACTVRNWKTLNKIMLMVKS